MGNVILYVRKVARWRNGYIVGLAINRSRVQILLGTTLLSNLGHVVHTYVPLGTGQRAVILCGWEGNRRSG